MFGTARSLDRAPGSGPYLGAPRSEHSHLERAALFGRWRFRAMNFLGIGPLELTLVIVVAVIVLGPERIPEVAVQIAKAVKFLRGYATSATSQMRTELDELTREYEEVRRELQEFRKDIGKDVTSMAHQVSKTLLEEPALKDPIIEPGGEPPPKARDEETPDRA